MGKEQSKSAKRRFNDGKFHNQFFIGRGIDIGAGKDSLALYSTVFRGITQVDSWDKPQGNAEEMLGIQNDRYDFVHSSHCLEHMENPYTAFRNWLRITKPGGHLIITVPDAYMYEHGKWPSRFNGDHKWRFTTRNIQQERCINVLDFLMGYHNAEVKRIELIEDFYDPIIVEDQTRLPNTECAIEMIVRKYEQ